MIKTITAFCMLIAFAWPTLAADEYTEELFELYCHSCHGVKGSGAPQAFTPKDWKPYLKKGTQQALNNAINGIGNMPAMGTCAECGPDELLNLIEYMSHKE